MLRDLAAARGRAARRQPIADVLSRLSVFRDDQRGAISAFMLVMLLTMFVAAGIAIDVMRHETVRSALQNGLDRGVLAAASLDQTLAPEEVIAGYLHRTPYLDERVRVTVNAEPAAGPVSTHRRIAASARTDIDTIFLRLVGIPTLEVAAVAAAEHARQNVEISLVLDISGTMAWEGRLQNLIPAARSFIRRVLTPETAPYTTINLIPYAGSVNPGPELFALLGGQRFHNQSSCIELGAADFDETGLPAAGFYRQVPHFHWWPIRADQEAYMDTGWCPSDARMPIEIMSNDADRLVERIEGLRLHDGTGTHIGMKWALALLDPGSNWAIGSLIAQGRVSPDFADRPKPWHDPESLKFIVLMTDGMISDQNRPAPPYLVEVTPDPIRGYDARVHNAGKTTNRARFFQMCNAAKAHGVTVFTIAFEVPAANEWEMRDCASSPAHFFSVEGLSIADAFSQIASTIENLKLVN
ncbi:MAG: hypothetical protein D6686_00665 [Alphaproteobacteria bacterium]|nr:MAG: hypothetical protein D6686_00665 [Alphaproteobacteria bacterium]